MTRVLPAFDLGLAPYEPVLQLQARLRREVADGRLPGVLLLLEHPPVITLGSRGGPQDLTAPPDSASAAGGSPPIPVVRSERGGAATLHAPGQLVSYPIVRIRRRDLRAHVRALEETLVGVLADSGVKAVRSEGRPGLYVDGRKIASMGLRCERWVASHGTSLNVTVDLSLFDRIVSCGEADLRQTSIQAETGRAPDMSGLKEAYRTRFAEVLGWETAPLVQCGWHEVEDRLRLPGAAAGRGEVSWPGAPPSGGRSDNSE